MSAGFGMIKFLFIHQFITYCTSIHSENAPITLAVSASVLLLSTTLKSASVSLGMLQLIDDAFWSKVY